MKKKPTPYLFIFLTLATACQTARPSSEQVVSETYIHRYGVPLPEEEWTTRGKNGQVVSVRRDGVEITRNYESGILHGESSYTFPHRSAIEKKETYEKGKLIRTIQYYSSGVPHAQHLYEEGDVERLIAWYENGSPQGEEEYIRGKLVRGQYFDLCYEIESEVIGGEGKRTRRDGFGLLQTIDQIQQGRMVSSTSYHSNGAPAAITPYVHRNIHGQKRTFSPGGDPVTIEQWVENKQQGTTIVFENGAKVSDLPYVDGKKQGVEKRYGDEGQLVQEVTWSNDQKHGPTLNYVNNTTQTIWYFQNKEVSKAAYEALCNQ